MTIDVQKASDKLLLCTDMDRTLLPNGPQKESEHARELLAQLVALPQVEFTFVTGRDKKLVEKAIHNYLLPQPDFVIGDVGSTIYQTGGNEWRKLKSWDEHIGVDWQGYHHDDLRLLLKGIKDIRLQELSKQGPHKLSYYIPMHVKTHHIMQKIAQCFEQHNIKVNLIWSLDEPANIGLLDILPARASKRQAIEFLMQKEAYALDDVVFAGDSGNDISVVASEIPSVLVANASNDVQNEAKAEAASAKRENSLYLAKGGYLNMNGNYSAGILEGVAHYKPEIAKWLEQQSKSMGWL